MAATATMTPARRAHTLKLTTPPFPPTDAGASQGRNAERDISHRVSALACGKPEQIERPYPGRE